MVDLWNELTCWMVELVSWLVWKPDKQTCCSRVNSQAKGIISYIFTIAYEREYVIRAIKILESVDLIRFYFASLFYSFKNYSKKHQYGTRVWRHRFLLLLLPVLQEGTFDANPLPQDWTAAPETPQKIVVSPRRVRSEDNKKRDETLSLMDVLWMFSWVVSHLVI